MTDDDPRRCTAHSRTGRPCGRWRAKGLSVCPAHGGAAPQAKAAGLRRVAEAKAQATVAKRLSLAGVQVSGQANASRILLEELERATLHAQVLDEMVDRADRIVEDGQLTAVTRACLDQHREVSRQAAQVLKLQVSAARITREQADATREALRRGVRRWSVHTSHEDREELVRIVGEELRAIAANPLLETPTRD